ncbi:MAG: DUF5615 family PIN-like protein [Micrococcales bacterium]|nr:DUF5615 family PIN-like protein [Micrococcales bacterium]
MKRLLLDEMLPSKIRDQLPELDVLAVSGDPALRGMSDAEVLELAAAQGRILVTGNIRDFVPLSTRWLATGRIPVGMLFISSKSFPQDRARTGRVVDALRARAADGNWPPDGQYAFL